MRKVFLSCFLVLVLGLLGCSQVQQVKQYGSYRSDMWNGKKLLSDGDYKQSLDEFVKAAKSMPTESEPCAFAATASFNLDDVEGAFRYRSGRGETQAGRFLYPNTRLQSLDSPETGQGEGGPGGARRFYLGL